MPVNAKDRIGRGPWFHAKGVQIAASVADLHSDNNKINKETALDEKGMTTLYGSNSLMRTAGRQAIPRSRHDPKILWVDDAEIVGDRITKVRPIPGTFSRRKLSVASANWAQVA